MWFGGKSRVADVVWQRFGNVPNYVEPFAGSLAVLLARPHAAKNETINDLDAYLANFWRATSEDPEEVAYWADSPVNEADLHARHRWLVDQVDFRERMLTDPDFYDAKIAGWWVWGQSLWIGSGWCTMPQWRGRGNVSRAARGVHRQAWRKRPNLPKGGHGVHQNSLAGDEANPWRVRPHLGSNGLHRKVPRFDNTGIARQLPDISGSRGASGRGVHSKLSDPVPPLTEESSSNLLAYFELLRERLRRVRVCCGEWDRILGPSPTTKIGLTAVFLDPPYSVDDRADCYNQESRTVSRDVFEWALANGSNPDLRIALCGYEGEHEFPADWECVQWKAVGGYANQRATRGEGLENAHRERIWFSPYCIKTPTLFEDFEQFEVIS